MSADNGVYVLQTYGPEFRVAHAQDIDSIYGEFDEVAERWTGDGDLIRHIFGESEVFTEIEAALDKAEVIAYDYEYLEYGICLLSDFMELNFNDL